jgi:hypothetical protein
MREATMNDTLNLQTWRSAFANSIDEFAVTVAAYLPHILVAVLVLVLGWFLSKIIETIARKVFHRMGLDRAVDRAGLTPGLSQMGWTAKPSVMVAKGVFWMVMLTVVLAAIESLGLRGLIPSVDSFVAYVPNVIAASLIMLFSVLAGGIAGGIVSSGAAAVSFSQSKRLGAATRFLTIFLGLVLALEQLGVSTQVLVAMITTVVAVFGLSMGLTLALGSREVVKHILAGHYLRQSLPIGQTVVVGEHRGTLERIGSVDALFRHDEGSWTIPNARLLEEIVER